MDKLQVSLIEKLGETLREISNNKKKMLEIQQSTELKIKSLDQILENIENPKLTKTQKS